jgi:hypothetical protein
VGLCRVAGQGGQLHPPLGELLKEYLHLENYLFISLHIYRFQVRKNTRKLGLVISRCN